MAEVIPAHDGRRGRGIVIHSSSSKRTRRGDDAGVKEESTVVRYGDEGAEYDEVGARVMGGMNGEIWGWL